MKLIDLLVQELPKRGGWPDGSTRVRQDRDTEICFEPVTTAHDFHCGVIASDVEEWFSSREMRGSSDYYITREQYEAAIAAAQQQAWDGEGLPPAGCECEGRFILGGKWFFFRCVAVDCGIAFGWAGKDAVTLDKGSYEFRPIRSEAENKRAAGVTALAKAGGNVDFEYGRRTIDGELSLPGWYELYDKIAAGEVAGIRIE
ncbi:hypothetical protein SNN87_001288 [Cronobacter sakazakii]|nr:hypothetical protein [Cronobacter sakazakii]